MTKTSNASKLEMINRALFCILLFYFSREMVNKVIMECRHDIRVECWMPASRRLCKQPCVTLLSCGHQCKKQCGETCTTADCQDLIRTTMASPCGHPVMRKCSDYRSCNYSQLILKNNFLIK